MMTEYSSNPKITYAAIILEDVLSDQKDNPDDDYADIVSHRDAVLKRYQEIFSPQVIGLLHQDDFLSFLLFRNNHHWDSLHRVGSYMVENMRLLREALRILLDETLPIEDRINRVRPERGWGSSSMVSHLGMPVLTAILMVVYPQKYGVWNNTSDAGLKIVRLWEERWGTQDTGATYCEMNAIYHELCSILGIDLWTLDALWWVLKKTTR